MQSINWQTAMISEEVSEMGRKRKKRKNEMWLSSADQLFIGFGSNHDRSVILKQWKKNQKQNWNKKKIKDLRNILLFMV